ncbi:hypothetical protein KPL78_19190 [Roseomonas sp. HJA6]|uniref:Phage morphogenesis protein n=1 Tax=Roseomonas alba TaxID=2846776 RepID=A0ABS7AFP8_9PROT|nr:hypothetical protein [Neoroseomonas alba]MBW6399994.1 hypothetical protein [Neoroseomonas alba]
MSFATTFRRIEMTLDDFGRKQLPFAAALALTRTAGLGRDEVIRGMPQTFDRPTPFTMRGITIISARKTRLEARVLVKDLQAEYLRLQEQGGLRQPKKRALIIPHGVALNEFGNIPNRALQRLKRKKSTFVGKVRGIGGFWERDEDTGTVTLLARFDGPKKVTPHPFFFPRVETVMRRDFDSLLGEALEWAMRTARP